MDDLITWMRPHLHSQGLTLTGNFRQLNASPFFSLIRFETNASAVWFKAVGEPNLHEYHITKGLSEHHSRYLPKIIATKPEWNGWLMAEVGGTNLRNTADLNEWRLALTTLASLQVDLAGKTDWLLQIGCKDRRLSKNLNEIDSFCELMAEVMQQQPKTPPQILARSQLLELGRNLKNACHRLQSLGIPDSLVHGDFNPGNICFTSDKCVFLDWAEGYIGCPFVTFEYLLAHLRRTLPDLSAWEKSLREAYTKAWKTIIPSDQISEALLVTPLVAILCHALAASDWQVSQRIHELNCAKYMRGLVRRMHHEVLKQEGSKAFHAHL